MQVKMQSWAALILTLAVSATGAAQTQSQAEQLQLTDQQMAEFETIDPTPIATLEYPRSRTQEPAPIVPGAPIQDYFDGNACCYDRGCGLGNFSLEGLFGMDPCGPWNIGGWTQMGFHNDNIPLSQAYNDLLSFHDVPDRVHLNQQWFYLERLAERCCGLTFGARIDAIYGTDAQKTQSFGNPNGGVRNQGTFDAPWDDGEYGWAFPQLYGEIAYCNLSFKIGHWFSPAGYERVPSPHNFFYSRTYSFFNTQAFTHTGVLATYTADPCVTYYGGWALGWDTGFDQLNQGNLFVGGFEAILTDRSTFKWISTIGNFGWRDGGGDGTVSRQGSAVLTYDVSCRAQYVFASDFIRTDNPGISTFDAISLNNYLFYDLTHNIRLGGRYEWWKADGISFNEYTTGLNVCLAKNLVLRPEMRYDWAPGIGIDDKTFSVDAILVY